ncbi:MAG: RecX family transcriptional regulator [Candidatus Dojkabacteria bacterium]
MKVSKLLRNKRGNKIAIFLDDRYTFSVEESILIEEGLFVGKQLAEEDLTRIQKDDLVATLITRSLNLISSRPRSEKEIRDYLSQKLMKRKVEKGLAAVVRDDVLKLLKKKSYLNDDEFALWWVKNRKEFKTRSRRELTAELARKGIDNQIIRDVLAKEYPGSEEVETIERLAKKKLKGLEQKWLNERDLKQKLTEYLMRKGYSYDNIKQALNKL